MAGHPLDTVLFVVALAIAVPAGAGLLAWSAFVRPRVGLYAILALTPTQFVFVPVSDFYLSPADVLVLAGAAGLVARLAAGHLPARAAVRMHAMLGLMLVAYVVGFVVLGHFSRTLIRVPLAIVPSILACELLRTRRHFRWAIGALVAAALLDAAYGLGFVALGRPLHPTRFSGLMGVNFSALVILTGAALAFGVLARTRNPLKLVLPAGLALLAVATLSKTGLLALVLSASVVLWTVATAANRRRVLSAAAAVVLVVALHDGLRERVLARTEAQLEQDGIERTSSEIRVRLALVALGALKEQPLVGLGFGRFQPYTTRDPDIHHSTFGAGYPTHNTYLEVLVEGGLLAFAPFLLHFFWYARSWGRAVRAMVRTEDVVIAAVLSGFAVVITAAWAVNLLLIYLFWSVCGVALSCVVRHHSAALTLPSAGPGTRGVPGA